MAEFGFFNIGKANAEIDRLNGVVATLTAENASLKENTPQIEAAAEKLKATLTDTQARLSKAEADCTTSNAALATITAERDQLAADLESANEKLANPSDIIKQTAAAQAAAITASVGVPPVSVVPAIKPGAEPKPALSGLDRAIAAHRAKQTK